MSHRSREKERRRMERLAAEEAARTAAARRRVLQIGAVAVGGLVVLVVILVVALAGGGSKDEPVDPATLTADAAAAGCTFRSFPSEGRTHTAARVTYRTNPPTSGPHNPVPAPDGIYAPGNSPAKEAFVHSLEHGRIELQYRPGAAPADLAKLRSLAGEKVNGTAAYHVLVFENATNMPTPFAATAWTKSLACQRLTPGSLNVMREFRRTFTDKAPEFVP